MRAIIGVRKAVSTRLLIVERNPLVVAALKDMIEQDHRFELTNVAEGGEALLAVLGTEQPDFDVAIVGWRLSDMNAGDVLEEVQRRNLQARIVIFSNDHNVAILRKCVQLGAQGFCYQFDNPSVLFDTVQAVANGRICIPYIDVSKIGETSLSRLTPRELELLSILADGWTNLQIATRTGISENTVKYHLKNLYDKIGVHNRAMAVAHFIGERRSKR
ncbi:LuxR family transcriptional regulator [Mesorhizobium sp. Root552]|jgi:DNA-binding NarL/FixJ family response regulator|uniref:LuxR C-terminal-related transcriptional regulator n=1 Tax=Mesorhizobium sp. Root552 TaxID=1736555 RepID=UPI0006FF559D|nr:response regulator transcription factor [Mesorhizobium sp. Root552]KQZ27457.1 LuxR family transcriptional regulator [Mesorhizobium sp. Root552]